MDNSILTKLAFAILTSFFVFLGGCSTYPISNFDKIKTSMTKDEVLELVGNPNRTERFEGKEKWAYRYWTGSDKNVEELRQVTFVNGKVASVGEDVDEHKRIKDIESEDNARAERRKLMKSVTGTGAVDASPESAMTAPPSSNGDAKADDMPRPTNESDFVEMKGRRGPVNSDNEGSAK